MAGGWWLVAGGGWDWFYSKTNGFSISFGLFACKTNVFSTISVAGSIKPMLFQYFFGPYLYYTGGHETPNKGFLFNVLCYTKAVGLRN